MSVWVGLVEIIPHPCRDVLMFIDALSIGPYIDDCQYMERRGLGCAQARGEIMNAA